jgi:large subunit ribosomal protein L21
MLFRSPWLNLARAPSQAKLHGLFSGEPAVYAVIEDRGTQIKVSPGDVLDIDLFPSDANAKDDKKKHKVTFDRVLIVGEGDGEKVASIGTPYIDGASVDAEIVEQIQGEKLDVLMYKRRKGQRRKIGHRQQYLRVKITKINS